MTRPANDPAWATNANFGAGVNPWNGNPNKVTPSGGQIAEGFDPQSFLPAEWLNYLFGNHGDWIDYLDSCNGGFSSFGDGSDGSYTLDGAQAAVAGLFSKTGNVYKLLRDAYFINLRITGASVVLHTNGWRLFGQGTLTTDTGGSLSCDGNAAVGQTAGGPVGGGTLGSGTNGAAGGNVASSPITNGFDDTISYGGDGGDGGSNANPGSVGGDATRPTAVMGAPRALFGNLLGCLIDVTTPATPLLQLLMGGCGGGGGAGDVTVGGGGGGGAGVMVTCFRNLVLSAASDIHAVGGKGGDSSVMNNSAAGAGGGGGVILLAYNTKNVGITFVGAGVIGGATVNCAAGADGVGGHAAVGNAQPGTLFELPTSNQGAAVAFSGGMHVESGFVAITPGVGEGHTFSTINFSNPFTAATGANGYDVECSIFRSDAGSPIDWIISTKTTAQMVITFSSAFTGELRWRAYK